MKNKELLKFFKGKEIWIRTEKPDYQGKIIDIFVDLVVVQCSRHKVYINQEQIIAIEDYGNKIYQEKVT